jgi:putative two-component system response regulator
MVTIDAHEPGTLLVVDGNDRVLEPILGLLVAEGFVVHPVDSGPAIDEGLAASPDLVLVNAAPPGDGLDLCRRIKRDHETRLTPVLLIASGHSARVEGFEAGADEVLVHPVDRRELAARVRALARVKRYTDDLDSAASIIMALAVMIESRDGHTEGHCHRLANNATALGRRLGLSQADLQALHRAGFLHDVGMLAIPDGVLRRTGSLAPEEYELVKSHTVIGESLLGHLRSLQAVRPIVRSHHERCDGSGYPDGLEGDEIPLTAQILSLVDAYDALTSPRPYQAAKSPSAAIDVLREEAAKGWRRPDLVDHFAAIVLTPAAQ